jgi:phosphohistidine swiveling domain-containing protein
MTVAQAKQIAQQGPWWSEDCPIQWQYFYALLSAVEQRQYFHPDLLSTAFLVVKNGYGQEKTRETEKLQQYVWLKDQYEHDNLWLEKEHDRWNRVKADLLALAAQIERSAAGWELAELAANYQALMLLARDSCRWGFFIECIDVYHTRVLPERLAEVLPDADAVDRSELARALATPPLVSFMEEFQLRKLEILSSHRATILTANGPESLPLRDPLRHDLAELEREWGFLSVNYAGSAPLTQSELWRQLSEEAQRKSAEQIAAARRGLEEKEATLFAEQIAALEATDLPPDLLADFEISRELGRWIDERKESMVRTSAALRVLLGRICDLTGVPPAQLGWYTFDETLQLLQAGEQLAPAVANERQENSVFAAQLLPGDELATLTIFTGEDASALNRLLNPEDDHELAGTVASAPSGQTEFEGEVQVILDASGAQLATGAILVTSMTRPDFVPLLHQAGAIITDEGGLTCHAAIVSRELGIPCIIGTRSATRRLTTGDRVRLDLTTGTITKITHP